MIKNEHFLLGYQHHHDEISVVTSHLQPVDIVPMIHCPEYEPMVLIPSTEHSACCSDGQYAAASPSNAQHSVAPVPFSPVNIHPPPCMDPSLRMPSQQAIHAVNTTILGARASPPPNG